MARIPDPEVLALPVIDAADLDPTTVDVVFAAVESDAAPVTVTPLPLTAFANPRETPSSAVLVTP